MAGQPQQPLRQGVVRRGGAAPSGETWISLPTLCSLSPSPAAFWRPPHGRARHVGASVTPSLTLLHTRALHLVLLSWLTPRRSRVSPCRSAGQLPPSTHPPARPQQAADSLQTAPFAASITAPWTGPFASAPTVGTWERQEARLRHANGNDMLPLLKAGFR